MLPLDSMAHILKSVFIAGATPPVCSLVAVIIALTMAKRSDPWMNRTQRRAIIKEAGYIGGVIGAVIAFAIIHRITTQ